MDNQESNEKFDKNNLPETDDGFLRTPLKRSFNAYLPPTKKAKQRKRYGKSSGVFSLPWRFLRRAL